MKSAIGGATAKSFFGGEAGEIGVVVFLREMREDEIAGAGVEAFWVREKLADGVIRKMAGAAEDALLDDPGIRADLEHVEIVIGFQHQAIGVAQMHFDQRGHIPEVGDEGKLAAVGSESEGDGVGGIVRDSESVNVNVADRKTLAGLNRFEASEPLPESVRKNAAHRVHGGLGDGKRRLPHTKHLREAIAMVGMLVGDEDAVEMIDALLDGGKPGEGFALAETAVDEQPG